MLSRTVDRLFYFFDFFSWGPWLTSRWHKAMRRDFLSPKLATCLYTASFSCCSFSFSAAKLMVHDMSAASNSKKTTNDFLLTLFSLPNLSSPNLLILRAHFKSKMN